MFVALESEKVVLINFANFVFAENSYKNTWRTDI